MHIDKHDVPVKLSTTGATARQQLDFGAPMGFDSIAAEYFTLAAGTDIAPLLQGLDGDVCDAPHWGYLIAGEVVVSYSDGSEERCREGELFHWPAGHSVRVIDDADIILFSPQTAHVAVLEHMEGRLAEMGA
ncbi:MAG TPA: hypothetical protein VK866_10960 [Acidimicrobiales bacterium]|nr:hypothetical protein [Acidimicrobiales bacterium]